MAGELRVDVTYGIDDPHLMDCDPTSLLIYGDIAKMKASIECHHSRIAAIVVECIRGHLEYVNPSTPRNLHIVITCAKHNTHPIPEKFHWENLLTVYPGPFSEEIRYSTELYDLCKEYDILFIADEVRMGCGKTGCFLSCDFLSASRKPDLLTLGKSISGGVYPASFVLGRAECMDLVGTKEIISTFSFSPLAIAAATAALRVIDDECLIERARQIQRLFLDETEAWHYDFVSLFTARGADLGIWLHKKIDPQTIRWICENCMHNGLLVFPNLRRIRMSIAMVITDEELMKDLQILTKAMDMRLALKTLITSTCS